MFDENFRKRFDEKWIKNEISGCWLWTASCAGQMGYGQIKLPKQRKQEYAHRISYLLYKGIIPERHQVCHTCDNPKCVNPDHLFVGTSADNHADMKAKWRHLYGEKNGNAKLTLEQVEQIRQMLKANIPQRTVGKAFGVHQTAISKINVRIHWGQNSN